MGTNFEFSYPVAKSSFSVLLISQGKQFYGENPCPNKKFCLASEFDRCVVLSGAQCMYEGSAQPLVFGQCHSTQWDDLFTSTEWNPERNSFSFERILWEANAYKREKVTGKFGQQHFKFRAKVELPLIVKGQFYSSISVSELNRS